MVAARAAVRAAPRGLAQPCCYRLSSHFLPRLVLSQMTMPKAMTEPIEKNAIMKSISSAD